VRWANNESFNIPHTVTRDSGTVGPQSGILHPGDSYSYTFTASGTYSYHCQVHPMMKGKVIVTP
jgi:plastocyanin